MSTFGRKRKDCAIFFFPKSSDGRCFSVQYLLVESTSLFSGLIATFIAPVQHLRDLNGVFRCSNDFFGCISAQLWCIDCLFVDCVVDRELRYFFFTESKLYSRLKKAPNVPFDSTFSE